MKTLVPTRLFYSYTGYAKGGKEICYGNGVIALSEVSEELTKHILKMAKNDNKEVDNIHLIALTPLEMKEI